MAIPASPVGHQQQSVTVAREQLLEKVRDDKQLPSLGVALNKVIEITSSNDDSIADLARYILADVSLTQQILRLSNTIAYRAAGGGPVTTVSRAIFLLGFDTIKANAIAAMLINGFRNRVHAESVRHELLIALCASVAAREITKRVHHIHSEEAAVVALFKNIGRVIVAYFEHQTYQNIQHQSAQRGLHPNQVCVEFLGCSFERLGELVMRNWQIPETIISASQNTSFTTTGKLHPEQDGMTRITTLAEEIANLLVTSNQFENQDKVRHQLSHDLNQKTLALVGLSSEQLKEVIQQVKQEALQLASSFNVANQKKVQVGSKASLPIDKDTAFYTEFALPSLDLLSLQPKERFPSGKPKNARDLLLVGIQDANQMLGSQKLKLNDILMLALETLHLSLGFRFTTACLSDVKRSKYQARLSVGDNATQLQKCFQFEANEDEHVFRIALQNNTDLFVENIANKRIQALLPAWYQANFGAAKSFMVLPLVVDTLPLGFIYADRAEVALEGVAPDETALIRTLKAQLLSAFNRRPH
ncbi:HDOD domain-containing protein [Undibacterium cyanobacteriorum]|uniref:HDOD domain-containing protein n=1 Tax=Undibacterium cyanobacteriorum TaxID=3073561 RepID=A0ABY9RJ74_9BURK|nr:HDOD domain-containing protein [Undibacterium sp. 20NA77.5]WMW81278.1 HDOD domain-containing protein [Undibacterium sp. 20NA77.5]